MLKLLGLSLAVAIAASILLSGCDAGNRPTATPPTPSGPLGGAPRPPPGTEGELRLSGPPVLGKPVEVIYTFWMSEESQWQSALVTANIELPGSFELMHGALEWRGDLAKGSRVELKATVKAVTKGTSEISARAFFFPSPGSAYGSRETLYALVLSDRGFASERWTDLPGEGINDNRSPPYGEPVATSDDAVISLDLSLPRPPALGKTAEITLAATALLDAPGARIGIELPQGLSLVSGNLVWKGDLAKGDRFELKALVKATSVGKWTILGVGQYSPRPNWTSHVLPYKMFLHVFKDWADTVAVPPPRPLPKLNVDLSLSNLPALHQQATLTWRIVALNDDLPKARAQVLLPSNHFAIVGGDTLWEGELKQGMPVEVKVLIEPLTTGTLEVRADVSGWNGRNWVSDRTWRKSLYLQVSENSATLVPYPPTPPVVPAPLAPTPPRGR